MSRSCESMNLSLEKVLLVKMKIEAKLFIQQDEVFCKSPYMPSTLDCIQGRVWQYKDVLKYSSSY